MNKELKNAFDQVQADTGLKNRTKDFIFQKTRGYTKAKTLHYKPFVSAFACIAFLFFGGHWLYFTPTVEISIDINPSLELGVNRFDRVITLEGYNDDGRKLADSLHVQFMNYYDAVTEIMENENIESLLSDGEIMTISVIGGEENTQSGRIFSSIQSCTAGKRNTYCYYANTEDVEKAHEAGLSYGKYRSFLELQALDPTVTADEIQTMTMREIRDLITRLSNGNKDETGFPGNGGSGQGKQYQWGRQ